MTVLEECQARSASCYKSGCRSSGCRSAHAARERENKRRRNRPDGGLVRPLVDATEAREHLVWLGRQGVGVRQVAQLSGLPVLTVRDVRNGKRARVTARTERLVLGVGTHLNAFCDAGPARAHLRALANKGIGTNITAELAGVARHTTWAIREGQRTRIRKTTADAILAVGFDHARHDPRVTRFPTEGA